MTRKSIEKMDVVRAFSGQMILTARARIANRMHLIATSVVTYESCTVPYELRTDASPFWGENKIPEAAWVVF